MVSSLFTLLAGCFVAVLAGSFAVFYLNDYDFLPMWFQLLNGAFAVLLCLVDVVNDAICRGLCMYLQPFGKVATIIGTSGLILQLHLPGSMGVTPMATLACSALFGVIFCAQQAAKQKQIDGIVKKVTEKMGGMGFFSAVAFSFIVVIGGNGEQLLDMLTNYKIDKELAGGSETAIAILD